MQETRLNHNRINFVYLYMEFKLISEYKPTGDQPSAITELVNGIIRGTEYQTLLGVTGSGKTFVREILK